MNYLAFVLGKWKFESYCVAIATDWLFLRKSHWFRFANTNAEYIVSFVTFSKILVTQSKIIPGFKLVQAWELKRAKFCFTIHLSAEKINIFEKKLIFYTKSQTWIII